MPPKKEWLRGYGISALAGGALVLLCIVSTSFVLSDQMQRDAEAALEYLQVDALLLRFSSDLIDVETAHRGYIITEREDFLEPYRAAVSRFDVDRADLKQRLLDLGDDLGITAADTEALLAAGGAKLLAISRSLALRQADRASGDGLIDNMQAGKALMDEVRDRSGGIRRLAAEAAGRRTVSMQAAATALKVMISFGVTMIVLLVAGATAVIRGHVQSLDAARRDLAAVNEDLETRVRERTEMLTRSNEELQRYAYIVSHDLRAPLINIMGFTAELEADVGRITIALREACDRDAPEVGDALAAAEQSIPEAFVFIRSSMTRMGGLIDEILTLSRSGRRSLEATRIDSEELIVECVSAIRQRFDMVGAEVIVSTPLPQLVSDAAALKQIFSNLLDNAAKYLVAERKGRIVVTGRREGQLARFEVSDNGRGVAADDRDLIFELFRRAAGEDRPGDGIGLTHARMLARRLGGDITVDSDGASGSTFVVTLAYDITGRLGD